MTYQTVLKNLKARYKPAEIKRFEDAYKYAQKAHEGQKRKSGNPYSVHFLSVADYLGNNLHMDIDTVIAGLLHDVPEDTTHPVEEIKKQFGEQVAFMVEGITKLGKIKLRDQREPNYIETLRKMFLAMAADIRVVVIKLADRRHNMHTLEFLPADKAVRIARETLEIYAPIANRLGMGQLKGELEDLAFPYVYQKDYQWLKELVGERYEIMQKYVNEVKQLILKMFRDHSIKYSKIDGRTKHFYSLYQKIMRPKYDRDINKIYDLVALRIICKSLEDCYAILGLIHSQYKPMPGRIKDYIAFPKPNGYRSIHTTVFGPKGRMLEIQIRTEEMHEEAEYGIAAHWAYTEAGKPKGTWSKKFHHLDWVKQLRDWQKDLGNDSKEFMESLKIDFFKNRIFALTPKGDVKDLPEKATALDFAFSVHTELGQHAAGAKVNGKMAKLSEELENGDVIEILKSKEPRVSRDWLRQIKTSHARSAIRNYLNKHQKGWFTGILPDIPFITKK